MWVDWTLALGALVVGVVVGLTGMGGGGLVVGMTSVGSGSLIIIALMGLYPTLRPCPRASGPSSRTSKKRSHPHRHDRRNLLTHWPAP
jgi:hypothetical protein